ncbi:DUF4169 family protein [Devosia sp. XJ19-1]|uniref:DUF4169 family protein n=1 Tax=Devosia ureilytica TaxID=2952754 RepID=A0A9Q4AKP8_9HYPH|nr:DUF4169 family protein [Devosia ureilytica]MCP8882260.1 DUF4169 family protein [Devosia ureilytica]MCP8885853.1 DUF4169 family protein [Devosia ureilytica]
MADIINLRTARKAKARADKETVAEANRLKFGRTKAEKLKDASEKARADRHIDGHKRDE